MNYKEIEKIKKLADEWWRKKASCCYPFELKRTIVEEMLKEYEP